jgi:3-polyprenyl-4-hydroxybenzoate decarboxylase
MPIYKVEIPISDYYGEAVFFQELYFDAPSQPTRDEVVQHLRGLLDDPAVHSFGAFPWLKECLESIANINTLPPFTSWPSTVGDCIQSNVHVQHPRWGQQALTISRLRPVQLRKVVP